MANASLKITEVTGKYWEVELRPNTVYTIGRAKDNDIVLDDQRVSRHHAHIVTANSIYTLIDGHYMGQELRRSVNKVFVNSIPFHEKKLEVHDQIIIGGSRMEFHLASKIIEKPEEPLEISPDSYEKINFEDQPLGRTQFLISANEIIGKHSNISIESEFITPEEIRGLRRKAQILELLYEMSKSLGTVFDLKEIFVKATDLIFRGTPAERVVALIAEETSDGKVIERSLQPIAIRAREDHLASLTEKLTISRTITQKVMREKVALLSQDAKSDAQFVNSKSIFVQGIRSTICAPLITESNVHGVVYADRLDPFSSFSQEDLELISAVAAQTAVTVETVKAHTKLAREEVARANYSRFLPEYVVKQLLENPDSFKLGGVNQTITVLFADIRGFTTLSEQAKPEKIVNLLNRYFTAMSEIIFKFGGTLDKYIGDGLMAIFGAPTATPNDAPNALQAAVEMQKRLLILNKELQNEGFPEVKIGIGLHTGEATIGYIGSEIRSEYTAIGDTVNLAARLESNSLPGQILISEATARLCQNLFPFIGHKPLLVKNRLQPVTLFEVKWN